MKVGSLIALILIVLVLYHELKFLRQLLIKTVKRKSELVIMVFGVLSIVAMGIFFSKNVIHFVVTILGVLLIFADIGKQGIAETGLLIVAKGKELYHCDEIENVTITTSDVLRIDYYTKTGTKIVTHFYPLNMFDRIMVIFKEKNLCIRLCNTMNGTEN